MDRNAAGRILTDVGVERIRPTVSELTDGHGSIGSGVVVAAIAIVRTAERQVDAAILYEHVIDLDDEILLPRVDHVVADARDCAFPVRPPAVDARDVGLGDVDRRLLPNDGCGAATGIRQRSRRNRHHMRPFVLIHDESCRRVRGTYIDPRLRRCRPGHFDAAW